MGEPREWKPHWSHEKVRPQNCRASVWSTGRGAMSHQCTRTATHGKWCGQHTPEAIARRRQQQTERWETELRADQERIREAHRRTLKGCTDSSLLLEAVKRGLTPEDLRRKALKVKVRRIRGD